MNVGRPLYISFYTSGTAYEGHAKRLTASLAKLRLLNYVIPLRNTGSWAKNTLKKARFVLEVMENLSNGGAQFPAFIWIDADAIVHKPPDLFHELIKKRYDFGAHFRNWRYGKNELLSGTLFFANNKKARQLIKKWIKFNKQFPDIWEQKNLARALHQKRKEIKVYPLPIEYCCIFDDERREKIDPVIEHFQASRQARRIMGR